MAALGPIKPIRKPKPKAIEFENNNLAFIDGNDNFQPGVEIYVCIQEDPAVFELLDSGNYTTMGGQNVTVTNGIIDEIA